MAKYKLTEYRFEKMIPLETVYAAGVEGRRKAVRIINQQHCKHMVVSGTCIGDCNNCKEALTGVFTGMDPKSTKNPWGLFTYRVRTARMRMIEQHVAQEKSAPLSDAGNFFDKKIDPLDALDRMLQ